MALSPLAALPVTTAIRADHTHVLAAFHRYRPDSPWWRKRAIVSAACTALEIHMQLEEEILYPALARVDPDDDVLKKSEPEHDAIRQTIERLRGMEPDNAAYDNLFMQLMRTVIHHVADEEAVLLPRAERALKAELASLGAAMTRRRLQLLGAHRPARIALDMAGTFPVATALLGALTGIAVLRCFATPRPRSA
ncbi:hemerythrin domain-containing protein [Mycetohabitans rhizoxinica]|uniref:hemerythrin domain-containing protein n=1 Tax=Mycetohabitans TaxID=2571159 RepID=UPI001F21B9C4|nr:hemerythrin domain-containing protein [Mycetohabitans sp. B2]MCF7696064.1 hemerythrin domain-containing protein [Mycetohabitans sp. B2]